MQVATIRIGKVENGYVLNVSVPRQGWTRFLLRPVKRSWVAKSREELETVLPQIVKVVFAAGQGTLALGAGG